MAAKATKKSEKATKTVAKKTSNKTAPKAETTSDSDATLKSPAKAAKPTAKKDSKLAKPVKSASKASVPPPTVATPASAIEPDASGVSWIPADKDYALALIDGKVVGRNPKGAKLSSVPPWLKETELAQQLGSLKDWLAEHDKQSLATVELWMLRSLPVPRDVLAAIWPDPAWQSILMNAVVCSVKNGEISQTEA